MEPITTGILTAVLLKVLDGASGEAGSQLWTKFTGVVQRTFGRRDETTTAVRELEASPEDRPARIRAVAERLVAEAEQDPELESELREWLAEAEEAGGNVTNVIGGNAKISGSVLQARDVHGGITFGGPASS